MIPSILFAGILKYVIIAYITFLLFSVIYFIINSKSLISIISHILKSITLLIISFVIVIIFHAFLFGYGRGFYSSIVRNNTNDTILIQIFASENNDLFPSISNENKGYEISNVNPKIYLIKLFPDKQITVIKTDIYSPESTFLEKIEIYHNHNVVNAEGNHINELFKQTDFFRKSNHVLEIE